MVSHYRLPPTFTLDFRREDLVTHRLMTSQVPPLSPEEAFPFFRDPGNLSEITPDWLDFRMTEGRISGVCEGAEFAYTIKLFGLKFSWRSMIVNYTPPERFIDIQLKGPYQYWRHLHAFEAVAEGTLMRDEVTYRPPLVGLPLQRVIIKRQLEDIFCYRAIKIAAWSQGKSGGRTPGRQP